MHYYREWRISTPSGILIRDGAPIEPLVVQPSSRDDYWLDYGFSWDLFRGGWTRAQIRVLVDAYARTFEDWDVYDCADNPRWARVNNPAEMAEFRRRKAEGCCGEYEQRYWTPDGPILLGFNYGH